jgi:hypothetical protein
VREQRLEHDVMAEGSERAQRFADYDGRRAHRVPGEREVRADEEDANR